MKCFILAAQSLLFSVASLVGPSNAKLRFRWVALSLCLTSAIACSKTPPPNKGKIPFSDNFSRDTLGEYWRHTGGIWGIRKGSVYSTGAHNQPLFLDIALPTNFALEVDVHSDTSAVDAKIELMTNGRIHQSGYIFILGGWNNQMSVIARLDEHGRDRMVKQPTNVVGKKTYRWRIEKENGTLRWYINGEIYMTYNDSKPLQGKGHDRLAFSNWWNQIRYDNFKIWPLDQAPAPTKGSPPQMPAL